MGDVTICKRDCYSGLDADKPASANLADTYTASDTKKRYTWDGVAWKTGLGYEFVPRRVATPDKQVGDFTTDGTWKADGLDLSAIVPAGAVQVLLKVSIDDDAAGSYFQIQSDQIDIENDIIATISVANIGIAKAESVAINANRLLDYNGSNLAFIAIDVTVLGWWI